MNLTLLAALLCIALWVVLAFVRPLGVGVVHALLGLGMILLTRRVLLGSTRR